MKTTFSFVVPTRGRTAQLRGFLDSVRSTTRRLEELEVILVIDGDDEQTLAFEYEGIRLTRVRVPPGLTMGAITTAGYRAARGQYLMFLNDDVIARTPYWDDEVLAAFRCFPDGIALVHVNDLTFGNALCIFPCLPREFVSVAGRLFSEDYQRYRIDDHIHNIFDLLALLGQKRRIYLPAVIFEHTNVQTAEQGTVEYVPDAAIHEADSRLYDSLLPERKAIAVEAMSRIEQYSRSGVPVNWARALDRVTPEALIRNPEHARWFPAPPSKRRKQPRVTIGVVSADSRSPHARECLDAIANYTVNYELIVLDNAHAPAFCHPREMNRLLAMCRTEYLVLMDDDVFVPPGWLEGMLSAFGTDVGVVTPRHRNGRGELSYAGIVMSLEDSGDHTHILEPNHFPRRIQTLCSAILMIDMGRCGHVRFDERFPKYFLDIDYGLRVWEEGFQVVCSASSEVIHLGGGTLRQGSPEAQPFWDAQKRVFEDTWIKPGRVAALRDGIWRNIPEIDWITSTSERLRQLMAEAATQDPRYFARTVESWFISLYAYPALKDYILAEARRLGASPEGRIAPQSVNLEFIFGLFSG